MKDKFLTYSIEEFAAEPQFINWVKSGEESVVWENWIEANPQILEQVNKAKSIVAQLREEQAIESEIDLNALWNRIDRSTTEAKVIPLQVTRRRSLLYIASIAAAACIGLLIFFGLPENGVQNIQSTVAEHIEHTLPDGSSVALNAVSSLGYNKEEWSAERKLSFEGEGFFEVTKGNKFTVETNLGNIEVLGTSFNIFSRDNKLEVKCATGKVKVSNTDKTSEVILNPGDVAILNSEGKLLKSVFNTEEKVDWVRGVYQYRDQKLEYVFEELERQFKIKITAPINVSNSLYTGTFNIESMDDALDAVAWPMRLKLTREGNQITFSEE